MSRLVVRRSAQRGVFRRGPFRGGLGDVSASPVTTPVPPATDSQVLALVHQQSTDIIRRLEEQDRARKWTLMIGGASALFAAVKLGLVTFGHIKSRSSGG